MKFFFDTEFIEDGRTIDLISIGMVSERGDKFYACSTDAQLHKADNWVRSNVLTQLPLYSDKAWMSRDKLHQELFFFIESYRRGEKPEFWAYYADYDWVAFCQLWGKMIDLPSHYPKFCRDLKQLSVDAGSPPHPADPLGEHNALADAQWNKELYDYLMQCKEGPAQR